MNKWRPISKSELEELIEAQLRECNSEQKVVFEKYRVPLHKARILRSGNAEEVFVVAKNGSEVMYYEDIEQGFNLSPISDSGEILSPGWEQDELKYALLHWLSDRS